MLLAQVLICNHIAIFNVAVPIIFIYFIIRLPISLGKGILFTLAFIMGLSVDIFADTTGVNALACTVLAAMKHPIYYAYVPKDDKTKFLTPSISSLGIGIYCKYLVTMVGFYCVFHHILRGSIWNGSEGIKLITEMFLAGILQTSLCSFSSISFMPKSI